VPTDMSDAIRLLGSPFTVTRTAPASTVDGYTVLGAQSTFTTSAVPYPLEGDELQRLPEGLRAKDLRGLICDRPLQTASDGPPDVVAMEGQSFEVERSEPWTAGNFFRVTVSRKP
jgi:hypothetical protein